MKTSARPLLDNAIDCGLFVGRTHELAAVGAALSAENNVLVVGERGIGRTSFLRHLQFTARIGRDEMVGEFPMHYVRVEGLRSGLDLLARIVQVVTGTTADSDDPDRLLELLNEYCTDVIDTRHQQYRDDNPALPGGEPRVCPVIIVDDVTAAAGHELFGRFRDEVWSTGFLWVVSARDQARAGLLTAPADVFFEKVVELPPLTHAEMSRLIELRAEPGEASSYFDRLAGVSERNPRRLVDLLRALPTDDQFDANMQAASARDAAIHRMGRAASMLAAEMATRGAVSASDDDLLVTLGWSRPRAAQVFKALEAAGLVTSHEAAADGPGRPKRVFELTEPSVWQRLADAAVGGETE